MSGIEGSQSRKDGDNTEMNRYSVLIPCIRTDSGDALLLEVRSQNVRQPGEVCFPGGRAEPGETPAQTAIRETCEELGICPTDIEITSELEPLIMGDGRKVYPITARLLVDGIGGLRLSEYEVEEVFLLPVPWLEDNRPVHYDLSKMSDDDLPEKLLDYLVNYGSYRKTGETDYMEYEGYGIWGLTARIIKNLNLGTAW